MAGCFAALIVAGLLGLGALEEAEVRLLDWRFATRPARAPRTPVVVVGIDDSTFRHWQEWPLLFWGTFYAQAFRVAQGLGARWIGFDIIPTTSADEILRRCTVHPERFTGGVPPDAVMQEALADAPVVLAYTRRAQPLERFEKPRPGVVRDLAFVDLSVVDQISAGSAQVVRAAPLFESRRGQLVASLDATLALRYRGRSPSDPAALRALAGSPDPRLPPGWVWINYPGPGRTFPHYSLQQLAEAVLTPEDIARFQDAVVLIGPTYSDSNDHHPAPIERRYGVEIHAAIVSMLLDGRPLRRLPPWREVLLVLGLGLAWAGALGWERGRSGEQAHTLARALTTTGLIAAVFSAAAVAVAVWLFRSDRWAPLAAPLCALWGPWLLHFVTRAVEENRARRHAEKVFGRQVSVQVAEQLLQEQRGAEVFGERREVTVIFTDIRGFTQWSDTETPEGVFQALNPYLARLCACIEAQQGVVDKYIGDAVMAVWNGALTQPDHAQRAVSAAWAMREALTRYNSEARHHGRREFSMGVGVNTGEAVVGNMGGETRNEWSCLGRTVNMGARLESATKDVLEQKAARGESLDGPILILLGEETHAQLAAQVRCRRWIVTMKGLGDEVPAYELLEYHPRGKE